MGQKGLEECFVVFYVIDPSGHKCGGGVQVGDVVGLQA